MDGVVSYREYNDSLSMATMRAVQLVDSPGRARGSLHSVSIRVIPRPIPPPGFILVRVAAVSLNACDRLLLQGQPVHYRQKRSLSRRHLRVPGMDFSGVVEAVGPDYLNGGQSGTFRVGDHVCGTSSGAFAEYVAVRVDTCVRKPPGVTWEAAAAIPTAATTALQALRTRRSGRMLYSSSVGPGDRVLVHGASGGVGSFAVQLAKSMGAHVTATCSHSSTAAVHALGADFVVVDVAAVAAANGDDNDKKFDRIVDLCGRSQWYPLLKPDGKLVQVALPRNDSESVPCILCGTGCSSQWSWPCCCQCLGRPKQQQKTSSTLIMRVVKADLQELMDKLADGTLRVAIRARLVGLDAVPDALMGGAAASSASSSSSTLSSDATAVGIDASPLAAVGKTVVVLSGDGGDNNDGDGGSVCSSAVLATVQPTSPEMKR